MILDEKTYVNSAEQIIKELSNNKDKRGGIVWISSSKIRKLLSMSADIYNDVLNAEENLPEDIASRIEYLRIKIVYECGREKNVNDFVKKAKLLDALNEINNNRSKFITFNHYMEALVAFHTYYGK